MSLKNCILFIFISTFYATSFSQNRINKDTIPLQEIVVSGTKTPAGRDDIPSTVSVLSREEMDETGESAVLSILSERIPGLFVTEKGVTGFGLATGSAGTVNIRGVGGGNKVLMLFDGQPQWAGIFGHHLPDTYSTSDVERVEVVRGPASLLYGSNAMGGAINIITRKSHKDGIHGKGRLMYGSFNTQKYMLNTGMKSRKWDAFLSVNHDRTDGHRENSAFKMTNGSAKIGYTFSPQWKVATDFLQARINSQNPGQENNPLNDNTVDASRGTYSFSVENDYEKMKGAFKAFYNFGHHEINDGYFANGGLPRKYIFNLDDHNAGFSIYESFFLFKGNLISTGIDFKNWGGHAWNDSVNGKRQNIIDKNVSEGALYLLVQQAIANRFTFNAGVRLEINETYGKEWIPQAGITYRVLPRTDLKASVSKGFRSPSIRELYMYGPVANPDLKPESMMNYDCSIIQNVLNNKLNLELTAFFAQGENLIQTIPVNGKNRNMNSGSFINKGIEFVADYKILSNFNISGNYSFLHTDKPIIGSPKHQAFLNAYWRFSKFSVSSSLQYVGELYTTVNPQPQTEFYTLLDGKITYFVMKNMSLFVNGNNLTNRDYTINAGFPMPGIVVMGGIDLKF